MPAAVPGSRSGILSFIADFCPLPSAAARSTARDGPRPRRVDHDLGSRTRSAPPPHGRAEKRITKSRGGGASRSRGGRRATSASPRPRRACSLALLSPIRTARRLVRSRGLRDSTMMLRRADDGKQHLCIGWANACFRKRSLLSSS